MSYLLRYLTARLAWRLLLVLLGLAAVVFGIPELGEL